MKKATIGLILAAFALGAALAAVWGGAQALTGLGAALNGLGQGLRRLSCSGGAGNALAWALLLALGLLPLLGLLPARRRRAGADWLWAAASVYALFMLYALVNPQTLRNVVYPDWAQPAPEMLATVLFAPLAALIVGALFLRLAREDGLGRLLFARFRLLLAIEQALAALAAGLRVPPLFSLAGADLVYGAADLLGLLVEASLLILTLEAGKALLAGLALGWLKDENALLADRLALRARRMLAGDVAVMLARCFLTLALGARLSHMDMTVNVSAADLMIALGALLLARFVREGVRVRAENDQFI